MWNWHDPVQDLPSIGMIAVGVLLILGLSELFKKQGFSKNWTRKTAHIEQAACSSLSMDVFQHLARHFALGSFCHHAVVQNANMFQGVHGVERSVGAFVFLIIILIFGLAYGNPYISPSPSISDALLR